LLLDEVESMEGKAICPVTMPVLIDQASMAILAVDVAPIRRMARRGSRRQRWLARHERMHGKREDQGRNCVRKILGRIRKLLDGQPAVLVTDQKSLYGSLRLRMLCANVQHITHSGKAARTTWNPLFPFNLTEAMLRDNNGRLRRRTWLVSKRAGRLRLQAELFAAYRNWIRPRTNHEPDLTPGMALGAIPRAMSVQELLAWRQDWRNRSIHPLSKSAAETVLQEVA
jgi:hypothetical protein